MCVLYSYDGKKKRVEEQKKKLAGEFLDAMQIVSNCLVSGSSMENAWREAEKELGQLHGENSLMYRELNHMNASVRLNQTIEDQLEDFAERSGLEDVKNFSEVYAFAKRGSGDMVGIIENTVDRMRAKIEVQQEIDVMVSSRKIEQKVLNVIPIVLLGYLKLSSGEYLSVLYGNAVGIMFMTGALAAYAGAIYLADRILRIEV